MKKIIISLVFLIICGGCWNKVELNDFAIVTGIAIDYKEGEYEVSLLISNSTKGSSDGSNSEIQTAIYSDKGKSMYDAIKQIGLSSSKELYIEHVSILIVSEDVAKNGLNNIQLSFPINSDVFLTEACEYTNSFLDFFPRISIILNVEEDHMDFFKDIDDIRSSFHKFAVFLPEDGALILNKDIEKSEAITDGLHCKIITYSENADADYSAANIVFDDYGNASFDLIKYGIPSGRIALSVAGTHNVSNALSAIAAADLLGISLEDIQNGLKSFTGTNRRFQYKGALNGVTIIDDYAHHPTEIRATLTSAKNYPHREIWCIFQPHTYTRTKAFFHEFAQALSLADHVILADIYAARETDTLGVSSEALAEELKNLGVDAYYLPSFDAIEKFVLEKTIHGDMLITMGAGDVVNIGDSLLS